MSGLTFFMSEWTAMKTIAILALDGVLDSSLAIARDTFATASSLAQRSATGGLRIIVAAAKKRVRTSGGLQMSADMTFDEVLELSPRPQWVVVPGLRVTSAEELDVRMAERDARAAIDLLQKLHAQTKIGTPCSAVFLLAAAGLLDGRDATTTWWLARGFRERYPSVRLDEMRTVVRDGRYLTAGSAFAQLDLSLAVVTDTLGSSVAGLCSRYLLIDQRPSQAAFMMQSYVRYADPVVAAAELWIDTNLGQAISVGALASAVALSPRTLSRRIHAAAGLSPVRFVQKRRLLQATHLLETSGLPVEEIAARVGYQDGTALRRILRRELGVAPGALRRRAE